MNRWDAWRRELSVPINALQDELSRLYDSYRRGMPIGPTREPATEQPDDVSWSPVLDIAETPDAILIWADVPGVDPAALELNIAGRVLTIQGRKADPASAPGSMKRLRGERPAGAFSRAADLPCDVDAERIEATAKLGVLSVRLPKLANARSRTIRVSSA